MLLKPQTSTLLVLSFGLLTACSTPPEKPAPTTAIDLAQTQLPKPPKPKTQAVEMPITELPESQPIPLKEVNQAGQFPEVATLSDKTLTTQDFALSDSDPIQLDFEQVSLRQIIEIIADHLNISMVIDPSIGDKVTLRTSPNKPLTKKDLWPLLQLLLNDAGITMERKGNIYHLKKTGPTLPGTIGISPDRLTDSDSPEVLQITPLRYMSLESALSALNPLVQPRGRIISLPNLNVIGIITTPQRLERVNQLISIIDADPFLHRGIRLFRLVNSKATEVKTDLDNVLKAISGNTVSAYQTVALERINAILVVAPPGSGFKDVAMWINILDERSEETGEQVFIYRVKNLEATKLASTLSDVFKIEDKEEEEERLRRERRERGEPEPRQQQEEMEEAEAEPPGATPPAAPLGALPISAELKVNIVADESTNSLLIRARPRDYRQLLETIYLLDQEPKEVMINVVIAEVQLTDATQFGIDWQLLFGRGNRGFAGSNFNIPSGNFAADVQPSEEGSPQNAVGLSGFTLKIVDNWSALANGVAYGKVSAILNFLASTNDVRILSRPSILVRNNEEASMNVGSNEPFLSGVNTSTTSNQILSNDVQYKDTGITLKVTPRINDEGIINMQIYQEVSQLGPPRTTQNLQSFTQRKVETSVVVRDGGAIVIGGLIETRNKHDEQSLPYLKDIPIIGKPLFSTTNKEEVQTELVLIIIPEIIDPQADNRWLLERFKQQMREVETLLEEDNVLIYKNFIHEQPNDGQSGATVSTN
ncbi:MAG: type II secretion system secretin GspD [Pseudomonadota bacterium]|nr:type II secretion system secretin GspD [Pseudomonadota bacterium]